MKIDTSKLRSMSVMPEEVEVLELRAGEGIRCNGITYHWRTPMVLMVDRLTQGKNGWRTTMIRQALECPHGDWGQDYTKPNRRLRRWAESRKMPLVTVPGGIQPLTTEGTVAVPDFSMSGTSWYIVPETVAVLYGADIAYGGALHEEVRK